MKYKEQLEKRYQLLEKADKLMEMYISIADELYDKNVSHYAGLIRMDIEDDGIHYEYWVDSYDYSRGRDTYSVSVEKIESLVNDYKKKQRKLKIKKLKNENNK